MLRRAAKDGILQVTVPLGGLSRDNVGGWNALEEMANWNAILFLKRAQREEEERETNSKRALSDSCRRRQQLERLEEAYALGLARTTTPRTQLARAR